MDRQSLIAALEQAEVGSRELDGEIAIAIGWTCNQIGEARWLWTALEDIEDPDDWTGPMCTDAGEYIRGVHGSVPHYSTSLDAALPGENIIEIKRISLNNGEGEFLGHAWVATHADQETDANNTAEARTEVIARRLAKLKATRP